MSTILVFGGAGYIGSHTCKALAEAGFNPVAYDNLSEGHRRFVRWGDLVEADIMDADAVSDAYSRYSPAAAIHFAAYAYVGESVTEPEKYYRNNVAGSINILSGARKAGLVPLVFSSSCATYGIPPRLPVEEDAPKSPINPYGRTKLIVEHMLADFDKAYGLRHISLRYFNACGADAAGLLGEVHKVETHVIPRAIFSALGRIDDFTLFGSDCDTPDGTPVRDYIHVTDLAIAHVLAVRHLLDGKPSDCFNIGTGQGVSIKEMLLALEGVTGSPVPFQVGAVRSGDPPILVADPAKAKRMLGFAAKHSDLANILRTAFDWHVRNS